MRPTLVAALALPSAACSMLLGDGLSGGTEPAPDAAVASADADASSPPRVLRFRAASKLITSARASTFTLDQPSGTQPGDLLWVSVASLWGYAITPPSGFVTVAWDFDSACGAPSNNGGWAFYAFSHVATATEPTTYTFTLAGLSEGLSALMLALDGGSINGALPASDGLSRIRANPFAPPTIAAPPEETYALATFTGRGARRWSAAANVVPLGAISEIAVFGRPAPAVQAFDFGSSTSSPDGCGFAHVALVRLK